MKNTMGGHESLKGMEKVLTSIIIAKSTIRNTKMIFNYYKKIEIWKTTQNNFSLKIINFIENNH